MSVVAKPTLIMQRETETENIVLHNALLVSAFLVLTTSSENSDEMQLPSHYVKSNANSTLNFALIRSNCNQRFLLHF